jgi:hypothetical protein
MIATMIVAYCLAMLKIDLLILIATFGVFRLLAVAPTLYALFIDNNINIKPVFWTIIVTGLAALVVLIFKLPVDKLTLSLIAFTVPALTILYQHRKAVHAE